MNTHKHEQTKKALNQRYTVYTKPLKYLFMPRAGVEPARSQ